MKKVRTTKDKAWVNRVFVVVLTVVLTLVGRAAYDALILRSQTQLSLESNYYPFVLPEALRGASDLQYQSKVERELSELGIEELFVDLLDLEYEGFWTFLIENTGSKTVNDISLIVPFTSSYLEGYYELKENETIRSSGSFNQTIEVGSIKPSGLVKVKVWTPNDPYRLRRGEPLFFEGRNPRVTFDNGYKLATFPSYAPTVVEWLVEHTFFSIVVIFIVVSLIFRKIPPDKG